MHTPLSGQSAMDAEEIRRKLKGLATNDEKIRCLEGIAREGRTHVVLYTLASFLLEEDEVAEAADLLREDLERGGDLFEQYESYSLLFGISMDRGRELIEKEVSGWTVSFDKMREEAHLELQDLEAEIEAIIPKQEPEEAPVPPGGETKRLLERKRKLEDFFKDGYQFERMLGDYYHGKGDLERAFLFYGRFYSDMDRPVEFFSPESMRNYVDLLLKRKQTKDALVFMGYLVNLRPYMLDDLVKFSDHYYMLGDSVSALLLQMFITTLSEGYSREYYEKSRGMIGILLAEMRKAPGSGGVEDLADAVFTGENIKEIPRIIKNLEKKGTRNFFFFYLRGLAGFVTSDYVEALKNLTAFNEFYPHLAESYYYALVCMYNLDLKKHSKTIVDFAEKAIGLKPGSAIAKMTKKYLGIMLGLDEEDAGKLLISSEIAAILNEFLTKGAPVGTLQPLVDSLTIERTPYQVALIQLLSKVSARKDEFCEFLRECRKSLNQTGERNVGLVLQALE